MTYRTFLFCDICNPYGTRNVELRRDMRRSDKQGRRLSDDRTWFDGDLQEALSAGWQVLEDGRHVCPRCQQRRSFHETMSG